MREARFAALVALALAVATLSTAASAGSLTKDQVKDLEQGKVIMVHIEGKGTGYIGGNSYGLMDEDIDKAWNAIQDARVYALIYPTTLESKVIKKKGNKQIVKMVQGNKLVKATYYLNYTADEKAYKLSWKLNKSMPSDIADSRGHFQFSKYKDGRTLMTMSTILDLGNEVVEKLFGEKIAAGLLRLPKKFRKYLAKPEAQKYVAKPATDDASE
jgi:ribosomal protein L22